MAFLKIIKVGNENKSYYQFQPPALIENDVVNIYWDKAILTDVTITHNRHDITLICKQQNIIFLIDIYILNTSNKTIEEKYLKYTELLQEVSQLSVSHSILEHSSPKVLYKRILTNSCKNV